MATFQNGKTGTPAVVNLRLRNRIFDGALSAFIGRGYEKTSMDLIAVHAKVSRASLYNAFESKEDLVRQLLTKHSPNWIDAVLDRVNQDDDPIAELRRIGRRFLIHATTPEALSIYRLTIAEAIRFPWIGELFRQFGSGLLIAHFSDLIQSAGFAPPQAATLSGQFYALLTGQFYQEFVLGMRTKLEDPSLDLEVDQAISFLGFARSARQLTALNPEFCEA